MDAAEMTVTQRRLEALQSHLHKKTSTRKVLIANRGEIAIRIAHAAASLPGEVELLSVAIYSPDDAAALHVKEADESVALPGRGVAAYLDGAEIIKAAKAKGADLIAPGYGFLRYCPSLYAN